MKTFFHSITGTGLMLCVFFLFSSCTKQIDEASTTEEKVSSFAGSSSCKAVVLGSVEIEGSWATQMQKWYGDDGKVAYLKANLGLALPWGEVTYHNNNQVYVRNTLTGDTVLRVTLDAQQRPAASYFRHPTREVIFRDTSYYYFTGNRLDSIISLFAPLLNIESITFRKINFSYDIYGNVVLIVDVYNNFWVNTWQFTYDYTQPVAGMLPSYMIDRPYCLLEYLDLLNLPVKHQLVSVRRNLFGLIDYINYSDYELLGNGLVQSYKVTEVPWNSTRTYYTGWDCGSTPAASGGSNRRNNDITSLEDFKKKNPEHSKAAK